MTDPTPDDYTARVLDLLDIGCRCHLSPPCELCTTMTEEHAEIYADRGRDGLRFHIHATEDGDDPPAPLDDRSETVCIIDRMAGKALYAAEAVGMLRCVSEPTTP